MFCKIIYWYTYCLYALHSCCVRKCLTGSIINEWRHSGLVRHTQPHIWGHSQRFTLTQLLVGVGVFCKFIYWYTYCLYAPHSWCVRKCSTGSIINGWRHCGLVRHTQPHIWGHSQRFTLTQLLVGVGVFCKFIHWYTYCLYAPHSCCVRKCLTGSIINEWRHCGLVRHTQPHIWGHSQWFTLT